MYHNVDKTSLHQIIIIKFGYIKQLGYSQQSDLRNFFNIQSGPGFNKYYKQCEKKKKKGSHITFRDAVPFVRLMLFWVESRRDDENMSFTMCNIFYSIQAFLMLLPRLLVCNADYTLSKNTWITLFITFPSIPSSSGNTQKKLSFININFV